jgi:signal-transduction protein with cAMP-binding, CBS, and nucleotidyltransferase domain
VGVGDGASKQGAAAVKLSNLIAGLRRGNVPVTQLITAEAKESLHSVALRMQEHNVGTVVIVKEQRPVGIVTDRDLALALGADGVSRQEKVESLMSTPVRTIPDAAGIFDATQCMRDAGVRRLPIVDEAERLVGIISLDDLLRLLGRELYNLAEGIRHEVEVK